MIRSLNISFLINDCFASDKCTGCALYWYLNNSASVKSTDQDIHYNTIYERETRAITGLSIQFFNHLYKIQFFFIKQIVMWFYLWPFSILTLIAWRPQLFFEDRRSLNFSIGKLWGALNEVSVRFGCSKWGISTLSCAFQIKKWAYLKKSKTKPKIVKRTYFYLSNLQIMSVFFSSNHENTVIINMLSSSGFKAVNWLFLDSFVFVRRPHTKC
jgi:hypothetical protein